VLGLIGYFDLDPNRALDIVLDLFVSHVSTHYAFFLTLLRQSPWCRRGVRNLKVEPTDSCSFTMEPDSSISDEVITIDQSPILLDTSIFCGQSFEDILRSKDTKTVPDGEGPPLCAQIIGFKFAHYQVNSQSGKNLSHFLPFFLSQKNEMKETTPRSLFITAALMIREGLMLLEDLYPHVRILNNFHSSEA
jgi:THO complex subunit 2